MNARDEYAESSQDLLLTFCFTAVNAAYCDGISWETSSLFEAFVRDREPHLTTARSLDLYQLLSSLHSHPQHLLIIHTFQLLQDRPRQRSTSLVAFSAAEICSLSNNRNFFPFPLSPSESEGLEWKAEDTVHHQLHPPASRKY